MGQDLTRALYSCNSDFASERNPSVLDEFVYSEPGVLFTPSYCCFKYSSEKLQNCLNFDRKLPYLNVIIGNLYGFRTEVVFV